MDLLRDGAAGKVAGVVRAGDACLERVRNRIVASNRLALEGAARMASSLGLTTLVLTSRLCGEAREAAKVLVAVAQEAAMARGPVSPPACILAGGETTVTIRGQGRGGRNQEFALAAGLAVETEPSCAGCIAVASLGTDGSDGPTDAAGAVVEPGLLARARAKGLRPRAYLARNDSYAFFQSAGGLMVTGPTGTNVMDIVGLLVQLAPQK